MTVLGKLATAPSVNGQIEAIAEALFVAGLSLNSELYRSSRHEQPGRSD